MERLTELRKSLRVKGEGEKRELSHIINKSASFLPFQTRNPERAKFNDGFLPVVGEFIRNSEGLKIDKPVETEKVIEHIKAEVRMDSSDEPYFEKVIGNFISGSKGMKVIHPFMYKYVPLSDNQEAVGEKSIGLYLNDALLERDNSVFSEVFDKTDQEHVLIKLVREHMPALDEDEIENKYTQPLEYVSDFFKEDLNFLSHHKDFFIQYFELLLAYYYFFSITQFTMKVNQMDKADKSGPTPLYYNLDWEASSKNRAAYKRGYSQVKTAVRNLLVHVNTLEHLNFIFETKNADYLELLELYESASPDEQESIKQAISEWIREYASIVLKEEVDLEDDEAVHDLVKELFYTIKEGYSQPSRSGTESRYALGVEQIGKKYFLKTRGSLGHTLNVSQDFLLLMTAVCVRSEKLSLKQLFKELEKRGLFFDRQSRETIQELFDKLNLIEKKSDSGDAQYVKPIL
ncbi:DNA phosphorothioation-dependent restriction protein DptG [Halobacillus locisalis]|uniref:DNA phosphorothioation-dependent restriction protein DptG n=1 Tax=Halobacillus locisalis TaxID=220753 RepID=A0A838CVH5_9BACI|nr:DNA phosphorothioation-dependent restriction protein DptG [Halobacillus locisalis]MBA2176142.1 DNA phosphorothioation-dependent restriction protein DptG [Halobacillus locisalis]